MLNKWMLTPAETAQVAYLAEEIDEPDSEMLEECTEAVRKVLSTFRQITTNETQDRAWQMQCAVDNMLRYNNEVSTADKVYTVRAALRAIKGESFDMLKVNNADDENVLYNEIANLAGEMAAYNPSNSRMRFFLERVGDAGPTTAGREFAAWGEQDLILHVYAMLMLAREGKLTRVSEHVTADEIAMVLVYDATYAKVLEAEHKGEITAVVAEKMLSCLLVLLGIGLLIGYFACFLSMAFGTFSVGMCVLAVACYIAGFAAICAPLTTDIQDGYVKLQSKVGDAARKLMIKHATAKLGEAVVEQQPEAQPSGVVQLPKIVQQAKAKLQQFVPVHQ